VADDEDDIRLLIKILLSRSGFDVIEAADGQNAWELATASPPDLIVLDIRMPRMTGLEALEKLKETDTTAHVPVLLISAYAQDGDVERGMAKGAVAYMTKPFQPAQLLERIRQILGPSA
jgi:CheY-like chemotaxis protein